MNEKAKDVTRDMTTGKPGKLIFDFALSLMLGNVFQQLYTFVDTIIVGRYLGVNSLATILRAVGMEKRR